MCWCVWPRTIIIGYDIAIIAGRKVNEPLLTNVGVSCKTEPVEIVFVLSDYCDHFTLKCDILLAK